MRPKSLADAREERNRALRALDMDYVRNMVPAGTCDEVVLLTLHKARYECTDLEPEFRHASAHWLRERSYTRIGGDPVLPEGQFPE